MTTSSGVAAGVVQAFQNCLKENNIDPEVCCIRSTQYNTGNRMTLIEVT